MNFQYKLYFFYADLCSAVMYVASHSNFFIVHANIFDVLDALPENIDGIIITDPPYPELEHHRAIGTTTRLVRKWFPTLSWDEIYEVFYSLCSKFNELHLYVWCNAFSIWNAKYILDQIPGLRYWNILVWYKERLGMGYHYRHCVEFVLFYEKGKRKLNDLSIGNFFSEKVPYELREMHTTAKPIGMQTTLIMNSLRDGDTIIDPFMGIGTSLISVYLASQELGFQITYYGIEICEEYIEYALFLAEQYGIPIELREA